ncbi:hypothetical protein DNTS_018015, partial [Danionella cerebrum]
MSKQYGTCSTTCLSMWALPTSCREGCCRHTGGWEVLPL